MPCSRRCGYRLIGLARAFPLPFILTLGLAAGGQQQSPVPPRDPAAVATVQAAVTALGGGSLFSTIQDATVTGTCTSPGSGGSGESGSATISWVVSGREYRYQTTDAAGEHV